jgi:hypothetical protein
MINDNNNNDSASFIKNRDLDLDVFNERCDEGPSLEINNIPLNSMKHDN